MQTTGNGGVDLWKPMLILLLFLLGMLAMGLIAFASDPDTRTETYEFTVQPHRLSARPDFWIYEEGTIAISVQWTGPRNLRLLLYGPGQDDPYLDVTEPSPITRSFDITSQILDAGGGWKWQLQLGNASSVVTQATVSITYPESLPEIHYFRAEPLHGDSLLPLSEQTGLIEYAAFPTQEFTLNWSAERAISALDLEWGCGAIAAELPEGVAADCPNVSTRLSVKRGSRTETLGELGQVYTLVATNKHGTAEARVIVLPKVWVGYHTAVCVGCSPCQECGRTSEAERIGAILREIDGKLSAGCITNNTELDRFNDPYLRGALTADILSAMRTLVIYPASTYMPDLGARTMCERGSYGYTPGDKTYVMICLREGADGLTLLHELEHYVDPNTTECRAPWVAQSCYGCPATIPCPECSN